MRKLVTEALVLSLFVGARAAFAGETGCHDWALQDLDLDNQQIDALRAAIGDHAANELDHELGVAADKYNGGTREDYEEIKFNARSTYAKFLSGLSCERVRSILATGNSWYSSSTVYSLREVVSKDGNEFYFFSNEWPKAVFAWTMPDGDFEPSNILVLANLFMGTVSSMPGLDSWVDLKGHVHTVKILKQQIEYRRWLGQQKGCESGCSLSNFLTKIEAPAITGIMDETTLLFPYRQLTLRFDRLYSESVDICTQAAGGKKCDRACTGPRQCAWESIPNGAMQYSGQEVLRASNAMNDYFDALKGVKLERPSPPAIVTNWPFSSIDNPPGGLIILAGYNEDRRFDPDHADSARWMLIPTGNEPENGIESSIDPRQISPETLTQIEDSRAKAEATLKEAEDLIAAQL